MGIRRIQKAEPLLTGGPLGKTQKLTQAEKKAQRVQNVLKVAQLETKGVKHKYDTRTITSYNMTDFIGFINQRPTKNL